MQPLVELWLNWLWQGALLTMLIAIGVRAYPSMNAATRERIWWSALLAVAALPALPLVSLSARHSGTAPGFAFEKAPSLLMVALPDADAIGAAFAWTWCVWIAISAARILFALLSLQRARAAAVDFPAEREMRLPTWMATRDCGRRARLVLSERVHRAAVLGVGRPVIALAPETAAQLTDAELDQIIVHEYAHVQRRDDLEVLVQRIVMAIAGLHPAAWWLSRAIALEREVACDDWVIARTGHANQYAACLVDLAAPAGPTHWSVSPGAALSRMQVTVRVKRLLQHGRNVSITRSTALLRLAYALVVVGAALVSAASPIVAVTSRVSPVVLVRALAPAFSSLQSAPAVPAIPSVSALVQSQHLGVVRVGPKPAAAIGLRADAMAQIAVSNLDAGRALLARADDARDERSAAPAVDARPFVYGSITAADGARAHLVHEQVGAILQAREIGWSRAADVGTAIGKRSREAAVGTAGFFSRFGKSLATSF